MQVNLKQNPNAFVVINPVAGVSKAEMVREKIQSALQAHQITFEIYETTGKDNLRHVVRDAVQQGFDLFLAAGGDGTLSAVAAGLVDTQKPLAIVPTGTWNALARNLDIPLQVDQALELLFQEHAIRAIDVMQVGQNFPILNVSAGIGSRTMSEVTRQKKRRFGKLPDLWNGLIQLIGLQTYQFEITLDGKQTVFRASELMVANSRIVGLKSFQLDPEIHMDDGKLNVCRIYADNLLDYFRVALSMLTGEQKRNWNVLCLEGREVEIHANEDLPVQADGEMIGHLPVKIKIHPKAVHIITPTNAET